MPLQSPDRRFQAFKVYITMLFSNRVYAPYIRPLLIPRQFVRSFECPAASPAARTFVRIPPGGIDIRRLTSDIRTSDHSGGFQVVPGLLTPFCGFLRRKRSLPSAAPAAVGLPGVQWDIFGNPSFVFPQAKNTHFRSFACSRVLSAVL